MLELSCVAQNYAWGKFGLQSSVAQLKAAADADFQVDPASTYAELWMGTHPNGPSRVVRDGKPAELLSELLQKHPELLGGSDADLPYLFKVLSVNKALSIQAHPDIPLAQELHANFPDLYKDANHKPEMAIALTPFEAMCQFRPIDEIVANLRAVPELAALVGQDAVEQLSASQSKDSLREFFRSFIYSEKSAIAAQLTALRSRLEAQQATKALSSVESLVLRLHDQYQNDIGCFCPFILNCITLKPGEAIFLGANEPHAYLLGDCIECMAGSDNVVRAGLTPKFIDKDTLHRMLTYRTGAPSVTSGERLDDVSRLYTPPVPEFEVEAIELGARQKYALKPRQGASLVLIVDGEGSASAGLDTTAVSRGRVYFQPAGEQVTLETSSSSGLKVFRASPNESVAAASN